MKRKLIEYITGKGEGLEFSLPITLSTFELELTKLGFQSGVVLHNTISYRNSVAGKELEVLIDMESGIEVQIDGKKSETFKFEQDATKNGLALGKLYIKISNIVKNGGVRRDAETKGE